ncbi:MAG TPA: cupin domain-containing protein, partial [Longimicrobiaceae bacterium]|nr:cupin domain-containing protein [Longimicrobiaceae bacterium]
ALEPWPFSELVYLLEGELTLSDAHGRTESFGPGEVVLVPRGVPVVWHHDEPIRKYFVVFDSGDASSRSPGADTFIRFDPAVALEETGDGSRRHVYYEAENGASAGVWEAGPRVVELPEGQPFAELMIVVNGSAAVVDGAGRVGRFGGADVALLPPGVPVKWRHEEVLRKIWVAFDGVATDWVATDRVAPGS